jgi:uncharacterized metal-binding protein
MARAHLHTISGGAAYAAGCGLLTLAGQPVEPTVVLVGTFMAAGWALWPDLDTDSTAACSLGWLTWVPSAPLRALGHRGLTHRWWTTLGLAALAPFVAPLAVFLGLAWASAGFDQDDAPRRRLSVPLRLVLCLAGAWVTAMTAGFAWAPLAVLVGGWAHLAGDAFRWKYPDRRRVAAGQRAVEVALWLITLALLAWLVAPALAGALGLWSAWRWLAALGDPRPRFRRNRRSRFARTRH